MAKIPRVFKPSDRSRLMGSTWRTSVVPTPRSVPLLVEIATRKMLRHVINTKLIENTLAQMKVQDGPS